MKSKRIIRVTAQGAGGFTGCSNDAAEFDCDTGRLLISRGGTAVRVWFPPLSWIAIGQALGFSGYGLAPDEAQLAKILRFYAHSGNAAGASSASSAVLTAS